MYNKNYAVLGLGISGTATINFLLKHKYNFIAWDDSEKIREKFVTILQKDTLTSDEKFWQTIDYLILSPGVPLHFPKSHPLVSIAKKNNVKIICDLELFYLTYTNCTYIGVTGTNGKSTTVALIYHILHSSGIAAKLVGNIGNPILSVLPSKDDIIIIEASSYQLDLIDKLRFNIAILLNITEDHIDRHGSIENYIKAKCNIFKNQTKNDLAIINFDNIITAKIANKKIKEMDNVVPISTTKNLEHGIFVINTKIEDNIRRSNFKFKENKSLLGAHNFENIAASFAATVELKKLSNKQILESISSYKGLNHRMQYLGTKNGIEFINDSKATNAESTEKALKTFDNIYWIVGGLAKTGGIESLNSLFHKIKYAFLVGNSTKEFAKTVDKYKVQYVIAESLEKAFNLAIDASTSEQIKQKNTLLLSPACASFDQWKSFEERGDFFANLTKKYINAN